MRKSGGSALSLLCVPCPLLPVRAARRCPMLPAPLCACLADADVQPGPVLGAGLRAGVWAPSLALEVLLEGSQRQPH